MSQVKSQFIQISHCHSMSNSMSSSSASDSEYPDGLAFRFKRPKGTGLSLKAVDIKDGVPKLRFSTSHAHKVSSITEEDVATCVRLCLDNKRPEFFYSRFLPFHPFAVTGRHYKQYKPSYLRGTSVGELFAEADWKMKCLHVGVMSDENKETFKSWPEASNLNGLATIEDFSRDEGSAQVLMTCESVDVSENEQELIFVGDPEMKISDSGSSSYTSYIKENFHRVAYYDEPCFLKMMEIVKLIVAVEWFRNNSVKFSEEWIKEYTNKPKSSPRKPVQVSISDEERNNIMEQLQEGVDSALKKLPQIPNLPSTGTDLDTFQPDLSLKVASKKVSDSGVEFMLENTHAHPIFKALTGLNVPVVTKMVARITIDDHDFLYEGIDPNKPVIVDGDEDNIQLLKPDVRKWSELFAETMPIPCKWIEDAEAETKVLTGGCTTSTIPVRKTVSPVTHATETVQVKASKFRKPTKILPSASHKPGQLPPSRDAHRICTDDSTAIEKKEGNASYGWTDRSSRSLYSADGQRAKQSPSLNGFIQIQQLVGGKEVGEPIMLNMYLSSKKA